MLNRYLDISTEVKEALEQGKPVVALESTIISHGMPYPQNVETAMNVEKLIRENGAVPATIAIIKGRLKAGLTAEEIDYLGRAGHAVPKGSRRDLPVLVAKGSDGACTVTTTMMIAHMAGIQVFATGGIGGVHRGAETTMDISADLEELGQTPVMVVCAGAKSILDLGLTLEYLETKGVPVIGYGTNELPAFYTRKSGFGVDYQLEERDGVLWINAKGSLYMDAAAAPTLFTGSGASYTTIQADGYARWYQVGDAAGKTMTVQVPENSGFWVYDGNGQVTASSVLWGDTTVTLPEDGTIVFAGDPGARFHLRFQG